MSLPQSVKIVEVSPRDGLQNEQQVIAVENKVQLINDLRDAGVKHIEVTGFVSPKWVPQLADATQVATALSHDETVSYSALAPNMKGFEAAMDAGFKEVAVFTAASETFNQKNINCSIAESFERFAPILEQAKKQGIRVRGYVSCVLGCPFEGDIEAEQVAEVSEKLFTMGCYEVSLGDTIGVGTPLKAQRMFTQVAKRIPTNSLAVHFHDTYGQALANILACIQEGARIVDASVAGLGGCPYAPGASGNVSTEDVVYMLHGMGINTGIDLDKLIAAGVNISQVLNRPVKSQVANALHSK
ncbi:hydroxymethylglutaryl-CoA lyase [Marinicella gelatinilytica]|uniref:hydroxymethylglutaryl-CoA lyase n=1 Tax=Marinicella gelatinilytica TaxID=2996017 RepID=UPI0022608234|nr:hydroxymethylglutaryl-CoA lyase [Marinicella gelatinilytica]MCX7544618.1 hydroxymethylglutaryl-CoA lyase [Marinicella gelatinilytica]